MFSLFTIAYPALSAMQDGRKRLTWRIIKMSLIISMPFSGWLIFYSKNVLQLFNTSYVDGYLQLEILLVSMLPIAVMTGVTALVYSYGNYKQVLLIGLSSSIPRAVLYFMLVPIYGGEGASLSYTIGSIVGFVVSIIIAKKVGMQIMAKDILLLLVPTTTLSFLFSYIEVNYIIALLTIPIITWISLLKIGIITRHDLHDSIRMLPANIANPALNMLDIVGKKLNRSY
jgi:O-antigen/teichoic acid export membrane protein